MKKVLSLMLVAVMAFTLSLSAYAVPDGFTKSVESDKGPELIDYENENELCTADMFITPYSERGNLSEELRLKMEEAYNMIVAAADDLTVLTPELAKIANEKGVAPEDLAVSDLFDLSYVDCITHADECGYFRITIKVETAQHFVALLHLNGDKWEVFEDTLIDGNYILFKSEEFSPFAIVVETSDVAQGGTDDDDGPVKTGDIFNISFWVMVASSSALLIVLVVLKRKKA